MNFQQNVSSRNISTAARNIILAATLFLGVFVTSAAQAQGAMPAPSETPKPSGPGASQTQTPEPGTSSTKSALPTPLTTSEGNRIIQRLEALRATVNNVNLQIANRQKLIQDQIQLVERQQQAARVYNAEIAKLEALLRPTKPTSLTIPFTVYLEEQQLTKDVAMRLVTYRAHRECENMNMTLVDFKVDIQFTEKGYLNARAVSYCRSIGR